LRYTSVIGNLKINNPTCDVVNDVDQDFSLKYSNTLRTTGGTIPFVLMKNCGLNITWNDPFPQPSTFF
jgi:hypothetical protein